jgi:hypothetical protein
MMPACVFSSAVTSTLVYTNHGVPSTAERCYICGGKDRVARGFCLKCYHSLLSTTRNYKLDVDLQLYPSAQTESR